MLTRTVTAAEYVAAFTRERAYDYPQITAFEARMGAMVDRADLETAASVLACPVKVHPPNWQHGRVLYAAARRCFRDALYAHATPVLALDIGTAKGFSALMLQWALRDSGVLGRVVSIDVIDPNEYVQRNTIAEVDGLKTLAEILAPWREALSIEFVCGEARSWLAGHPDRIHCAFVDGKHTYDAVRWEVALLATRQQPGDVIVFDDLQIPGVVRAVDDLRGYDVEYLKATPQRRYAIARKQ